MIHSVAGCSRPLGATSTTSCRTSPSTMVHATSTRDGDSCVSTIWCFQRALRRRHACFTAGGNTGQCASFGYLCGSLSFPETHVELLCTLFVGSCCLKAVSQAKGWGREAECWRTWPDRQSCGLKAIGATASSWAYRLCHIRICEPFKVWLEENLVLPRPCLHTCMHACVPCMR